MPAILRERYLLSTPTPIAFRRADGAGGLQWLHPLTQMYATVPVDTSPAQRTALIVLAISTPLLALLILLFILSLRSRARQREAGEQGFKISNPTLIPEPAKTYMPPVPIGFDMAKTPPMMSTVDERPIMSMPEPQINLTRPGGTPIGELPSLEVTPPSLPNSNVTTPQTPRTLQVPRSPGPRTPRSPRSPRSPRGHLHHGAPPGTPFGDVADQPMSANSLERMIHRMESDLKSPRSPRRF